MNHDNDIFRQAVLVSQHLLNSSRQLVTAESCTGGWIGKALTDIPGSSRWYRGGVIAYSNELKQQLLGVNEETLATHGAVSDAVAREMATGALERLGGDIAVAVSGIAGPDGAQPGKPVGTVWIAFAWRHGQAVHVNARLKLFSGDREEVRRRSVMAALQGVAEL
ncbi:MAG: CinA family protein [Steroidobacter sp.]